MYPKYEWITPKILEIRFDRSYELCDASYLFSHHYEDPHWNGKVFTRLELDEHYEINNGDPHYWKKRWAGSNLPDKAFDRFLAGDFLILNDFEIELLNQVRNVPKPFYVIMTSNESIYARDHEIAHALWYTNEEYRNKAEAVVHEYKDMEHLAEAVSRVASIGYSDFVLIDELHVYCGIFYDHYLRQLGIDVDSNMRAKLTSIYQEHRP